MHQDAFKFTALGEDFAIQENNAPGNGSRGPVRAERSPDHDAERAAFELRKHLTSSRAPRRVGGSARHP